MRVISGKFKYKCLCSPANNSVRPTTDRIKETIFNILSSKGVVGEVKVLDLFSGSGALGIESLSRGAEKVVFIDKSKDSFLLTKKNLEFVGAIKDSYEIYNVDYEFALKKLKEKHFDLIFVDPPYALHIENKVLDLIKKFDVLSKTGVIMIEHETKNVFNDNDFDVDCRNCGSMSISFLTYKKEKSNE